MGALDGQIAIVTGSSRGIGQAIAEELGRHGAAVVINYVRSEGRAKEVAEGIQRSGGKALAVRADVASHEDVRAMVETTVQHFGRVDILVNNAGLARDKTLKNLTPEMWHEVVSVKLDSMYYCTRAVWPYMLDQKYGRIVNISSVIGQMGNFGQSNYAAANAGIIGFTKAVALEGARSGITVNAICPGFVETEMLLEVPEKLKEQIISRIPLGRFARTGEIAKAVVYLVSEAGAYITGQSLNINGGLYM